MLMSAGEFKRFLSKTSYERIIFSTINSDSASNSLLPISIDLEFKSLYVDISPPSLCINGDCGSICFDYVKQIDVSNNEDNCVNINLSCINCGVINKFRIVLK